MGGTKILAKHLPLFGEASVSSDQFFISWFLDPLEFSFLDFTGLGRQLTALSVVKLCSVVFVFPHRCLPLFHLEELFPFSAWKQAAGQQQVSLFLVVRSLGQPPFFFFVFLPAMSQSNSVIKIMFCLQLFKSHGGFVFQNLHFQLMFCACHFSFLRNFPFSNNH